MSLRCLPRVKVLLVLCIATIARAEDPIGLDNEHKGETRGSEITSRYQKLTSDAVKIDLKAGQSVELSVVAIGDTRAIAVILWNADGVPVASSALPRKMAFGGGEIPLTELKKGNLGDAQHLVSLSKKTDRVVIREVPSSGTYTIRVYSNISGAYTLIAKDLSKVRDVNTIESELKTAKERVEKLELELKQAKMKKKSQ